MGRCCAGVGALRAIGSRSSTGHTRERHVALVNREGTLAEHDKPTRGTLDKGQPKVFFRYPFCKVSHEAQPGLFREPWVHRSEPCGCRKSEHTTIMEWGGLLTFPSPSFDSGAVDGLE